MPRARGPTSSGGTILLPSFVFDSGQGMSIGRNLDADGRFVGFMFSQGAPMEGFYPPVPEPWRWGMHLHGPNPTRGIGFFSPLEGQLTDHGITWVSYPSSLDTVRYESREIQKDGRVQGVFQIVASGYQRNVGLQGIWTFEPLWGEPIVPRR